MPGPINRLKKTKPCYVPACRLLCRCRQPQLRGKKRLGAGGGGCGGKRERGCGWGGGMGWGGRWSAAAAAGQKTAGGEEGVMRVQATTGMRVRRCHRAH